MSLIKYQLKSLQKTCLDYITRPCREKGYTSWIERVSFCYNCKIEECNHCIVYHCDACAFEDNLKEICQKLIKNENENNAIGLYYTLNQFFTLLTCYWGFSQPDKEKYDLFFDHLNFTLPRMSFFC